MADFDMFLNEGDEFGQSSQDKGKGKERETVNEFPTPPQPNQNFPRPQIPYRWPTPVATNDNTDEPAANGVLATKPAEPCCPQQHSVAASYALEVSSLLQLCARSMMRKQTLSKKLRSMHLRYMQECALSVAGMKGILPPIETMLQVFRGKEGHISSSNFGTKMRLGTPENILGVFRNWHGGQ
ncbi:uncharacterized protein BKA55DRAFT_538475 [Fusarium redolens]|uniref:Uncharacterized protein n=1 Tax=Fusarium redolens TaxID=48865 RepID=A0A9P9H9G6_FUSRE|nr:uncharacterized protein BKA55DRAFT_538475 [Fusarium redolens]KAH7253609.1 hypothetical protein BKA55DRAFT_538475 [Fusarium redolens]